MIEGSIEQDLYDLVGRIPFCARRDPWRLSHTIINGIYISLILDLNSDVVSIKAVLPGRVMRFRWKRGFNFQEEKPVWVRPPTDLDLIELKLRVLG